MGESKSSVHKLIKQGLIKAHSNAIKPQLTDANIVARLSFCPNTMNGDSLYSDSIFDDMFNTIHIDEKWFYMRKGNQKYYILPS